MSIQGFHSSKIQVSPGSSCRGLHAGDRQPGLRAPFCQQSDPGCPAGLSNTHHTARTDGNPKPPSAEPGRKQPAYQRGTAIEWADLRSISTNRWTTPRWRLR